MKQLITITILSTLLAVTAVIAAAEQKPITKVMLARLGWIQSISRYQAYSNYEGIATDASALAAQTKKVGEAAPAPFNKEMNLAISELAGAMAIAAANKDGATTAAKLGEILGKCSACHAKFRDKL